MFLVTQCYIARRDMGRKKMFFKPLPDIVMMECRNTTHFLASYERKLTTTSLIHKWPYHESLLFAVVLCRYFKKNPVADCRRVLLQGCYLVTTCTCAEPAPYSSSISTIGCTVGLTGQKVAPQLQSAQCEHVTWWRPSLAVSVLGFSS
jgi:hypothetical protein